MSLATFPHTQTTKPVDCQWKRQISPFLKYTMIEASYQQQGYQRWSLGESPVFVWSVLPDLEALWFYFPVTWRPPLAFIIAMTATTQQENVKMSRNKSLWMSAWLENCHFIYIYISTSLCDGMCTKVFKGGSNERWDIFVPYFDTKHVLLHVYIPFSWAL